MKLISASKLLRLKLGKDKGKIVPVMN